MKNLFCVVAVAALTLSRAAPSCAADGAISAMVDQLQRIQVEMAQGEKTAYSRQVAQLKAIAQAIASAKPETWKDKREADALVVYILSGGALADVVPLLRDERLAESERDLARGALAYMTNHEADAFDLLNKVDLDALDLRLAGQVAFARSVLEAKRDPNAALPLLDWARLVAPGSLVEEAALRREIALLAQEHDAERVALLTRQYAQRFSTSIYAPDFFHQLARMVAVDGLADNTENYQRLSAAAASLPADARRDFLLTLAKAAIVNARFDAASAAAHEALRGAPPEGPVAARARLYSDAARLMFEEHDAAAADLQTLQLSRSRSL